MSSVTPLPSVFFCAPPLSSGCPHSKDLIVTWSSPPFHLGCEPARIIQAGLGSLPSRVAPESLPHLPSSAPLLAFP